MNPDSLQAIVAVATGTAGLTAFLLYRDRQQTIDHRANDADVRATRDTLLADNRAQTAANVALAGTVEKQTDEIRRLREALERRRSPERRP